MKRTLVFFSVLALAIELPLVSLGGKDLKIWMFFSMISGLFLLKEIWKKNFFVLTKSKIFILGLFLVPLALLSTVNSPAPIFSLNQVLILVMLLVLGIFWENYWPSYRREVYLALAIGILGNSIFAFYQNIAFDRGWPHFEVMEARPNGFFPEPDWLGLYLALATLPFTILLILKSTLPANFSFLGNRINLFILNLLATCALTITVARSGWLAFLGGILLAILSKICFSLIGGTRNKMIEILRKMLSYSGKLVVLLVTSFIVVQFFGLTRFNLTDRFRSIFFKEHIITLAYDETTGEKIKINLEEKNYYIGRGYAILEEYVEDENVNSREEKAIETFAVIKKHPFLGNGLGINQILTDYQHNANNFFLEWWAGAGVLALGSWFVFFGYLILQALKKENRKKLASIFLVSGMVGFVLVNLFNASNLLAFAWFYFAWLLGLASDEKPKK